MYMYAIYEETGLCESTFSDFKEGKRCPSKSICRTFKFNAGIALVYKKFVISEKKCVNPAVMCLRIDTAYESEN